MIADGLDQVCFAESDTAVDDQRIERRAPWVIGNCDASRACELIAVTFDKVLKGVTGVEGTFDRSLT